MPGHECYHCKQWIEEGEAHDCWTTTEAALTSQLSDDLRDAWERLREAAVEFGDQRIYASHHSIMFSRKSCYFFVRPKTKFLEVCIFLAKPRRAPQVRRVDQTSKTKYAHFVRLTHRDEVEAPITDWLREAYDVNGRPAPTIKPVRRAAGKPSIKRAKAKPPKKSAASRKTRGRVRK